MKENLIHYRFFEDGARVKIAPGTRFYVGGPEDSNPKDVEGTINGSSYNDWINVHWDNGTKNSYEQHDLLFVGDDQTVIVDENKLYLEKTPTDLKDMLNILYPEENGYKAIETYYKDSEGNMYKHCMANRMRSFDDLWKIARSYFPEVDPRDVFKEMLLFRADLETIEKGFMNFQLSNCSTMKRIRYVPASKTAVKLNWRSIDVDKYQSVYSWRDLFNIVYINSEQQLMDWYRKHLKPVE